MFEKDDGPRGQRLLCCGQVVRVPCSQTARGSNGIVDAYATTSKSMCWRFDAWCSSFTIHDCLKRQDQNGLLGMVLKIMLQVSLLHLPVLLSSCASLQTSRSGRQAQLSHSSCTGTEVSDITANQSRACEERGAIPLPPWVQRGPMWCGKCGMEGGRERVLDACFPASAAVHACRLPPPE